ncbi:MAG: hypothetical protein ACI8ZO_001738 [Flavobacteriales bacterium]|jgi:hypothetical protein
MDVKTRLVMSFLFYLGLTLSVNAQGIIGEYHYTDAFANDITYVYKFDSNLTFRFVQTNGLSEKFVSGGIYKTRKGKLYLDYQDISFEKKSIQGKTKVRQLDDPENLEIVVRIYDQDSMLMRNLPLVIFENNDLGRTVMYTDYEGMFKFSVLDKSKTPLIPMINLLGYETIHFPFEEYKGSAWYIEVYLSNQVEHYNVPQDAVYRYELTNDYLILISKDSRTKYDRRK